MRSSRPAELFVHPAEDWERERGRRTTHAERDFRRAGQGILGAAVTGALVWAVIAWMVL